MTRPDQTVPIPGQTDLFGGPQPHDQESHPSWKDVRNTDPDTSRAAAEWHPGRSKLAWTVLALIAETKGGLADFELIRLLPAEHPGSVTKRRTDLHRKDLVWDTGERRTTPHGKQAIVWRITKWGRRALQAADLDYA